MLGLLDMPHQCIRTFIPFPLAALSPVLLDGRSSLKAVLPNLLVGATHLDQQHVINAAADEAFLFLLRAKMELQEGAGPVSRNKAVSHVLCMASACWSLALSSSLAITEEL